MSEKSTFERILRRGWNTQQVSFDETLNAVWAHVEADREAIRAGVREEMLKDHFRIGEDIVYDSARDGSQREGYVWINDKHESSLSGLAVAMFNHNARRPPKTRKMTDDELRGIFYRELMVSEVEKLSRPTLEAMAKDLGIIMEVTE